jgi:hypothetical protein
MRLIDLPRTTSFRLALLFVVLFGLSSLTLFGFLYWRMEGFLVSRVDDWLIRERIDLLREKPARLPLRLDNRARNAASDERIIALFDAGGQRIAGNSVAFPQQIPVFDKPFEFVLPKEDGKDRFRGLVHRLPSGSQILIAQNLEEIQEFDQVLVNALIWAVRLPSCSASQGRRASGQERSEGSTPSRLLSSVSCRAIFRAGCRRAAPPTTSTVWYAS